MRLAQLSPGGEKIFKIYEPEDCEFYGWTEPPKFSPDIILIDISDEEVYGSVFEGFVKIDGVFSDPEILVTLEEKKKLKREEISMYRYNKETSGMDFYGSTIDTDDRSKSLLFAAYNEAVNNPDFVDRWKTSDGVFRPVDSQTVIAMYGVLRKHITDCFAREAAIYDLINSCETKEELININWNMELDESQTNWNDPDIT